MEIKRQQPHAGEKILPADTFFKIDKCYIIKAFHSSVSDMIKIMFTYEQASKSQKTQKGYLCPK